MASHPPIYPEDSFRFRTYRGPEYVRDQDDSVATICGAPPWPVARPLPMRYLVDMRGAETRTFMHLRSNCRSHLRTPPRPTLSSTRRRKQRSTQPGCTTSLHRESATETLPPTPAQVPFRDCGCGAGGIAPPDEGDEEDEERRSLCRDNLVIFRPTEVTFKT